MAVVLDAQFFKGNADLVAIGRAEGVPIVVSNRKEVRIS